MPVKKQHQVEQTTDVLKHDTAVFFLNAAKMSINICTQQQKYSALYRIPALIFIASINF